MVVLDDLVVALVRVFSRPGPLRVLGTLFVGVPGCGWSRSYLAEVKGLYDTSGLVGFLHLGCFGYLASFRSQGPFAQSASSIHALLTF